MMRQNSNPLEKTSFTKLTRIAVAGALLALAGSQSLPAASGTWTNRASGNWSAPVNWNVGAVASGADMLADFSTLASGVSSLTVTLDTAQTLGNLKFGSVTNLYLLGNSTLTLENTTNTPVLNLVSLATRIGAPLASSQQVLITGGGNVSLTNDANNLAGGLIVSVNPFGFTSQAALGSGTIQMGNAPGGNAGGSGQMGFIGLAAGAAGATPVTINNPVVVRTIRWILGQSTMQGLTPQPLVFNGPVTLDMGNGNVRDVYPLQPVTINGKLSGGQSGTAVFGLNLNGSSPLTLANAENDFTGNITFVAGMTLGVNSDGALGQYQNRINMNTAGATLRIDNSFTIPSYRGAGGIAFNLGANATINCQANDLQVDAIIQGGATLTKAGTGKLILTAQNTFSGPITLSAGTLAVTTSGSIATSAGLTIPTNATFQLAEFGAAPNLAAITLNGGVFDVSGLYTPFTLEAGRLLYGLGVVNGSLTAAPGASVVPGTLGLVGTLIISNNLTLNGQTLTFDLRNDLTPGAGINDYLVVGENLTLSGGEKIYLNYLDGQLAPGTYKLIAHGGSKLGAFTLGAAYPNVTLDETSTPGFVTLVVTSGATSGNLTWKGDGTANVWNLGSAPNWVTDWSGGTTTYLDPAKVLFDDNGSNSPAVNLAATVVPTQVTFANFSKPYTLAGAGKISGPAVVSLVGTNVVTFTVDNDYVGATMIGTNATLQLGNGGGTGSVGENTVGIVGGSRIIAKRNNTLVLPTITRSTVGAVGEATPYLVQDGTGTTVLAGAGNNAQLGAIINSGTLALQKPAGSGARGLNGPTFINAGGTLQLGPGGDQIGSIALTNAGGVVDLNGSPDTVASLNGFGVVTDGVGGGNLTLSAAPGLVAQNGTLTVSNGTITLSGSPGLNVVGTLNMEGGVINSTGGNNAGVHGVAAGGLLNMNGGEIKGPANFYFAIGNTLASSGLARAVFNGGTFASSGEFLIGFNKNASVTVNPGATLDLNFFSYGDNDCTNYLNGGLIKAAGFNSRGSSKTVVNYFNGATIQAKGNRDTWIGAMTHAYIGAGGFIVDANGYKIGIPQALEHDPALGAARDGGLTKTGLGMLTLKGANTFNGPITNLAGALQFTTLGGRTSSTFVNDFATNIIEVAVRGTTVTNDSLTLGQSGAGVQGLSFNLGTLGLPTAPPLAVAGTLASAGNVVVGIIAPVVLPGQASLIKYGSFNAASFANWSVADVPYVGLQLSNNVANKSIDLVVAQGNYPTWTAANNNQWDNYSLNWKMSQGGAVTNYFEVLPPGPPVNFDDSATASGSHNVQMAMDVAPAFVTMSNSLNYSLEGFFGVTGAGALLKSGAGALILSNNSGANTYSGATLVTGGSLVAGVPNALSPASDTTLSGSTLIIGGNSQKIGNLTLNESAVVGSAALTGNGGTLSLNYTNNSTLGAGLAGTMTLAKDGAGVVSITNANTYAGATLVQAGALRLTDGAALGQGGFNAGTWTIVSPGAAVILDGSLSSDEHMHLAGAGPSGRGSLIATNGDSTIGIGGAHIALDADSTVYVAAGSTLSNLAQFYGGNRLTKTGGGLLWADIAIVANVTVSEGTLLGRAQFGSGNSLNDVSVRVNAGATLGGLGPVLPVAILEPGSKLTPGMLGLGGITFQNHVTNAAECVMEIARSGGTLAQDQVIAASNFVFTGSIVVTNVGVDALAAGDSFKLFNLPDYSALTGAPVTLPALSGSLFWTNRLSIDGTIAVRAELPSAPATLVWSISGNTLNLTWPEAYKGSALLVQANLLSVGLSTNWQVWPGSTEATSAALPIDVAYPSVFIRLVYPPPANP